MTDPVQRLAAAEANAAIARERLTNTLAVLQERVNPKRLARDAAGDVADAGSVAVQSASRHPGALAGLVAAAGLFLARHRIVRLVGGRLHADTRAHSANLPETPERIEP